MTSRHRLVRRQIASHLGPEADWPGPLAAFVAAVDAAYRQSDLDRTLLERSLDLSSQELLQANSDIRAVIEAFPDLFIWMTPDGTVLGCRGQSSSDLLLPAHLLLGKRIQEIANVDAARQFATAVDDIAAGVRLVTFEYQVAHGPAPRYCEARVIGLHDRRVLGIVRDITDRRKAELALHDREEQLRQAQKMEAVGMLAGGIAHDFNNLLTAITGYAALILDRVDAAHPLRADIEEIHRAGESAGSLTRQLLAFSRRQILSPEIVDLNGVVSRIDLLLRRLIGEDIELVSTLGPVLRRVKVDRGQIEQIIVNLALNARDAMPHGGRVTIETSNVDLDEAALDGDETVTPGAYAMLAVTDTGVGIPEELRSHIFEPFFTTKRRGEGTGLGLAMVYGIVRQSGGLITVTSEPGHGSTFKIFFPAADRAAEVPREPAARPSSGGTETILIAEDQPEVRSVTRAILTRSGYAVLEATCGEQALEIARTYLDPIDLLLTDVVMPGMSGRDLSGRLQHVRPEIRVLFASGYTDEGVVRNGILDPGVAFIQKPFTPRGLLAKIRDVLDEPRCPAAGKQANA